MTPNLPTLPAGWELKKLGDILVIERGGSPRPIDAYITNDPDGINWIKIGDTKNTTKYIYETAEKIKPEGLKKSRLVQEGDFILSNSMSFGRPYIMKTTGCIHDGWLLLRPKFESLDQDFLYHALSSPFVYQQFQNKASGTTVKNLNSNLVRDVEIFLPPLNEQKRLVSLLDTLFAKIDRSIELLNENIAAANALLPSALNTVFVKLENDPKQCLKDITSKIGSGATPSGGEKAYKESGISLIRSMNVHDYGFKDKKLAFIDDQQAQKLNNVTVEENDILLNITGASVARCCIADSQYLPARVNQHVSIIRLKNQALPQFVHYYLISPNTKNNLLFNAGGGATREAITKKMIEEFEIPLPPLDIQTETVAYLDSVRQKVEILKQVQNDKKNRLIALKASILDRAFKGEF